MTRPTPLPDALIGRPLTTADMRHHGLSPAILRGQRFRHRSRDLYVPASWDGSIVEECSALLPLLPAEHAFCHVTAAGLWGMPVPLRLQGQMHVMTPPIREPPRREGVIGHQHRLTPEHLASAQGLCATSPARTLLDMAPALRLHELVAAGDSALREGRMARSDVKGVVVWGVGRRGIRRLRDAEPLLHPGAESPQESVLRVWLVLAGLPPLEPNAEVYDGDGLAARVDLLSRGYHVAVEYEGAYHRSREQYAQDIRRRARLAAVGFEVVQVEASMMRSPASVVQHVSEAFRRHGWQGTPASGRLIR